MVKLVDTSDLKSEGCIVVPVQARLRAPFIRTTDFGPLAHAWLEQRTHNPLVPCSTHGRPTNFQKFGILSIKSKGKIMSSVFQNDNKIDSSITSPGKRYVFGVWGHIFGVGMPEVMLDFVYDRETEKVIRLKILTNHQKVLDASKEQILDFEDSLTNANPDAIEFPSEWDLSESDEIPN
jgi:hypothetical protein